MVPIAAENLRAAIELDGRGFAAIARDVTAVLSRRGRRFDENRQTLYALYRGGRRCRQSRLRSLSDVLGVPPSWLQGSVVPLPFAGAFHAQRLCFTSPRVGLALWRFLQRFTEASSRDLRRFHIETREGDNGELVRFEMCNLLCWALAQLVSPMERIREFLNPTTEHPRQADPSQPLLSLYSMPQNEEACWLSSIRMWESAFEPWLSNEQRLHYHALAEIAAALYPVMRLQRPQSTAPLKIVEVETGTEVRLSDPSTPFSLMPWQFGPDAN